MGRRGEHRGKGSDGEPSGEERGRGDVMLEGQFELRSLRIASVPVTLKPATQGYRYKETSKYLQLIQGVAMCSTGPISAQVGAAESEKLRL